MTQPTFKIGDEVRVSRDFVVDDDDGDPIELTAGEEGEVMEVEPMPEGHPYHPWLYTVDFGHAWVMFSDKDRVLEHAR